MKPEYAYERCQSAERMEAVMLGASAIGIATAIVVLFTFGWLPGLALFFLSVIAFALSRVFDLLAELLASANRLEESKRPGRSKEGDNAA